MKLSADKTVREIAIENPASMRVFESVGIDYCCGGNRPLSEACERADISLTRVLDLLTEASASPAENANQWNGVPLSVLVRQIVDRHHRYVRQEVARLQPPLAKVEARHGTAHPELSSIREAFALLAQEMGTHMLKEEQVLFPYIERMEVAAGNRQSIPEPFFGSVVNPIAAMMAEHDQAGELTRKIRILSDNYTLPSGACPSFLALYRGLEDFEHDLHQHVHLENNLLFPKALEMERSHRHVRCGRG